MLVENLRKPRLLLFLILFIVAASLCWQARDALGPFIFGLVIAYLILPLVNMVQRRMPAVTRRYRIDRPLAIVTVYLLGLLLAMALIGSVLPPVIEQAVSLYSGAPELYDRARVLATDVLDQYHQLIPPSIQTQLEERLRGYDTTTLVNPLMDWLFAAFGAISSTVAAVLGFIVIPFWLFFILNDESSVIRRSMGIIPHDIRADVEAVRIMVDRVLAAYIRGQLLIALALGLSVTFGLLLLQVQYALLLGLAAGALAIFPFIGAILGAIPALLVAFLQSPELALWVLGLFVVVQQIDNIFFSPKIMGDAVALHPALIMVVIVLGGSLLGVLGALVAVPSAAILRDIAHYFYIRLGEEPVTPVEALTLVGYGDCITPLMHEPPPNTPVLTTD